MTDEQIRDINEKISTWFEPKPEPSTDKELFHSPEGFWRRSIAQVEYMYRIDDEATGEWQPLDYYHSEDANARLRDAMLSKMTMVEWENWLTKAAFWLGLVGSTYSAENFRKVQVLAFCKFAGIEVESK